MKRMKQFISILLSVLIITSVMPITSFAAETYDDVNISGENEICKWSYTADNKTLYIDGETINGISDTANSALIDCLPIYTKDENGTFTYYTLNPEHLVFSKNVKSIGEIRWLNNSGCIYDALKTVEFEDGTNYQTIEQGTFRNFFVDTFIIPDSVKTIEQYAFENASILNINLNKVTDIGQNAFYFTILGNLTITESVNSIGVSAFQGSSIGALTWEDKKEGELVLQAFAFADAVFCAYDAANDAFGDPYDIVIPSSVRSIPDSCFESADLIFVTFEEKDTPNGKVGVKEIGDSAFYAVNCFVNFPSTLESIGARSFYSNKCTDTLDLSNTKVSYIGERAFYNNSQMTAVKLCEGIKSIKDEAFRNNTMLADINFPESLEEIGDYAFYNSKKVTGDLYLPNLKAVGNYAFYSTAITSFIMNTDAEDSAENPIWIGSSAFRFCKSLKTVVLPKHIDTISDNSFASTAIDSILIPADVISIENMAFKACSKLSSVDFSQNQKLTHIGANAFQNDVSLTETEVPASLKVLEDYAFNGCTSLQSVGTFSKNLESIGSWVFDDTALKSIRIESAIAEVDPSFYSTSPEDFVVYGYDNSSVAAMCNEYGYAFVPIDGTPELPDDPDFVSKTGSWANGSWYVSGNKLTITGSGNLTTEFIAPDGKTTYTPLDVVGKFGITSVIILGDIKSIPDNFLYDADNTYPNLNITNVSLPNAVMKIGASAFRGLNITAFTAPRELISIGEYAFAENAIMTYDFTNCSDLSIGAYAFADPTVKQSIDTITMNSTVASIGNGAFRGNTIQKLALTGVSTIGISAFQNVPITALTLDGTKFIGDYAFDSAKILSLIIPSSVTEIGKYAFANNTALTTLKFEENDKLYTISEGAFSEIGVSSVSIPMGVKRLEKLAFANCTKLKSFAVPSSIEYIHYDADALKNCAFATKADNSIIKTVVVEADPTNSTCVDYIAKLGLEMKISSKYADARGEAITGGGVHMKTASWMYYDSNKTVYVYSADSIAGLGFKYDDGTTVQPGEIQAERIQILNGTQAIGGLTTDSMFTVFNPKYVIIPNSVTRISENAFTKCERLEGISIPDSVTRLSAHVFDECNALTSVKFGNGVEKISDSLFKNLKSLRFVDLGGVKEIGMNAFKNCTNLEEIIIPDTVETVNSYAFYKCLSVKHITIGKNLANVGNYAFAYIPLCDRIDINTNVFNEGRLVGSDIFKDTGSSTTGIIVSYGDNITSANLSYLDAVKVRKIALGKNVTQIRELKTLPYLEEIDVDENNPSLFAYKNCLYSNANVLLYVPSTLSRVDIMPATEKIGENAFKDSQVLNITLPNGLNEIGSYAFYGCKELKRVSFPEKSTLKAIGDSAFENCSALKSVLISKPVEVIGKKAFKNCVNLTSIVLPDSLKTISQDAFVFCNSLTYVVVPEGTRTIDTGAFAYCDNLEEIYIFFDTELNYNAFYRSPKVNIHTIAASPAYVFARDNKIAYTAYTDSDAFFDIAMMKLDVIAGYLGYCANGHGKTEYLTVYEATCEHDGYVIGVCEDCSEILEEIHEKATGHNYELTIDITPTQTTKGMKVYTCSNCEQSYCETTAPLGGEGEITTQTVSGSVVIAMDKKATKGRTPVKGASIVIDGYTVATTDANGEFSFELESGIYAASVRYNYGFERQIYIVIDDRDVHYGAIPIIGCDWNKDGKIDDEDLKLFSMVASTEIDDLSYLDFVDMNGDGSINGIDLAYIRLFLNTDASSFDYQSIIIK